MKILPESTNLKLQRLFTLAFYGELAGICFGIYALVLGEAIAFQLTVLSAGVLAIHAFIVWSWGQRYALMDWAYALWSVPTILLFGSVLCGAARQVLLHGLRTSPAGLYIGDGAIAFWGLAAMLIALAARCMGVFWCIFGTKNQNLRKPSLKPIFIVGSIFLAATVCSIFLVHQSRAPFRELAFGLYLIGARFYGFAIYM